MYLKNNGCLQSLIFVVFFVAQQILSFTYIGSVNLVSVYWITIFFCVFIFIGLKLPLMHSQFKKERTFTLIVLISMLLMLFKGESIGYVLQGILCFSYGFIGYVYVRTHQIKLQVFDVLLICLYIFFYTVYFSSKEMLTNQINEGDLFGFSSSNSIPISLNITLAIYYILYKYYRSKRLLPIVIFSLSNFMFIVWQGSRIGVLVALLYVIIILYDFIKEKVSSNLIFSFIIFMTFSISILYKYYNYISDYIDRNSMQVDTYESDIRTLARMSFFSGLDFSTILLGYPSSHMFVGLPRTFNAFLDFWNYYGILVMIIILIMLLRRFIFYKRYRLSILLFCPLLCYCMVESFLSNGLWSIVWYFMFYLNSNKYDVFYEYNQKKFLSY